MDILGNNVPATITIIAGTCYIFVQLGDILMKQFKSMYKEIKNEIISTFQIFKAKYKIARLRRKHDTPVLVERRRERFEHTNYVYGFGDEIKEKK